mgnify:CR=1 FL=1
MKQVLRLDANDLIQLQHGEELTLEFGDGKEVLLSLEQGGPTGRGRRREYQRTWARQKRKRNYQREYVGRKTIQEKVAKGTLYRCRVCHRPWPSLQGKVMHERRAHGITGQSLEGKRRREQRNRARSQKGAFRCPTCRRKFSTEQGLRMHTGRVHKKTIMPSRQQ